MSQPRPVPAPIWRVFNGAPITPLQALIVLAICGATLWLGLGLILASEAVASIFTAALGYVFTAGVQERTARQASDSADAVARPTAEAARAVTAAAEATTAAAGSTPAASPLPEGGNHAPST